MTILVIAEHDHGALKGATLNVVTAAIDIARLAGGEVHVLVAGHNANGAATDAAALQGVAKVLHADAPQLAEQLGENIAAQVMAVAMDYTHLLFPATAHGKNVAPRVAALLDVAQISDATRVIAADTFERPVYAGNAIATVRSADPVKVVTVRTTGFDAAGRGGSAVVAPIAAVADSGLSSFVGAEIVKLDRPELTAAKIIVSGGRGLGSAEKFAEVLTPLADARRCARCEPGRGRRGLCTQRLAGRPDRQDRRPAAVRGLRHLRRHPAPGGHEGLEGDRRDQQGSRGADLPSGRLRPRGRPVRGGSRTGPLALNAAAAGPRHDHAPPCTGSGSRPHRFTHGGSRMLGQMMSMPLMTSSLLLHAERHARRHARSSPAGGGRHPPHTPTATLESRARSWRRRWHGWACQPGPGGHAGLERHRHIELYYGASGMGAVLHTINPRLFPSRSSTSPTTPRTRCCSSTSPSCRWWRSRAGRCRR
jgi:electron transfer flavoprotein alpha subunit